MIVSGTYHIGIPDLDNRGVGFLAVLVQRAGGRFKVYTGIVALPSVEADDYQLERDRAAQRIMHSGSPERYERAKTYYPALTKEQYDG